MRFTRPGRYVMTSTRSESCTASVRLCVISSVVCASCCWICSTLSPSSSARLLVERRERLVHQQDARLRRERPRDGDALAHAARQLRRIAPLEAARGRPASTKCARASRRSALATPAISSGNATLSSTVRHGNVDSSWNTMPIAGCVPATALAGDA